jgi:hypothetical protein
MSSSIRQRLNPSPDAITTRLGDETIVLDHKTGTYFQLDPIASRIWEALCAQHDLDALVQQIAEEAEVAYGQVHLDTEQFLADLLKRGLILAADKSDCREVRDEMLD